jgi:hypothetical protein
MRPRSDSSKPAGAAGRVRGEYLEMPGLILTTEQAQRLWGIGPRECRAIMTSLVEAGFLRPTPRGYVRTSA